jgi:hypothetical protein
MQVATETNGRKTKRAQKVAGEVVLNIFRYTIFGVPATILVILTLFTAKISPQTTAILYNALKC